MAANRQNQAPQSKSLPWGPMFLSFVVGMFIMFLMHLNDNVPADTGKANKTEKKQENSIKPTFDFYTLLPEMETVVPNNKKAQPEVVTAPPTEKTQLESQKTNNTVDNVSYMLQVGSFRKLSDADAFKAKLAFLGIESKVQTVTIDNTDTWHRVQVGPVTGRAKADQIQKQLKQNSIDSLLMRAKHS